MKANVESTFAKEINDLNYPYSNDLLNGHNFNGNNRFFRNPLLNSNSAIQFNNGHGNITNLSNFSNYSNNLNGICNRMQSSSMVQSTTQSTPPLPNSQSYAQQPTVRINQDDKWIQIQKNTFTNWINEQLKSEKDKINDLRLDFSDGVKLVKLVDALQKPNSRVSKRYFKTPFNQHQSLENVTLAINAITEDGIKLVNIGF
jgi:hypothetical protein